MTAAALRALLVRYRYPVGSEADLQDGISRVLAEHAELALREYPLGPAGRIDFYLPERRLGLEVKNDGTLSEVLRQLLRYARHPEIDGLVLVTRRKVLVLSATTLHDKPLECAYVGLASAF